MKNVLSKVIVFALLCLLQVQVVFAVPAYTEARTVTQPSGEKITITKQGDEWNNWVEEYIGGEAGPVLTQDSGGFWTYAKLENGELQATSQRVGINNKPTQTVSRQQLLSERTVDLPQGTVARLTQSETLMKGAERTSPENLLVLLVNFSDQKIKYTESTWANTFFGTSGATVRNYYMENSNSKFYFKPAKETSGTVNNGVVSVTLNYKHPNTGDDVNEANRTIVKNAIATADSYINFSQYDTNGNGYIDNNELHVLTIIAGYECSYSDVSPSVWGHRWSFSASTAPSADGVKICASPYGGYTQQGEIHGDGDADDHMAPIGIFCHELGHDIGLPDLYNTGFLSWNDNDIGYTSLMASGSWGAATGVAGSSPTHIDAYNKIYLGFVKPTIVSSSNGEYILNSTSKSTYNVLKVPTSTSGEYFLVENRNMSGYDAGMYRYGEAIDNGGIAIWHIDESVIEANRRSNTINNDYDHRGVEIERATQALYGYQDSVWDPFYSNQTSTIFSNTTTPDSKLYSGDATDIKITVSGTPSDAMRVSIGEGEPYKGFIETPQANSEVQGQYQVKGWYIAKQSITKVQVYVDNVLAGTATRFSKPSVTTVYPDYVTDNAGFSYDLDTTKYTNGIHTITIKATGEDGTANTKAVKVNVNNTPTFKSNIEGPISSSTISGTTAVKGWYIAKQPIDKVQVYVDNVLTGTATRFAKPSVTTAYPDYVTDNAGFSYNLDTTKYTNGTHTITIKATGADGTTHTTAVRVTVNNVANIIEKVITIDEEVIDEEVIDEEVIDEEVIDEEVIDEEVVDEEVVDEEVVDEEVIDEEIIHTETGFSFVKIS